jgi:hypothetical protein
LVSRLGLSINKAFQDAGGEISIAHSCYTAVYDEQSLGFWLDILLLMETLRNVLDREKTNLYGYAFLVGRDFQEKPEALCRFLAAGTQEGGFFLDSTAQDALAPYLNLEKVKTWPIEGHLNNIRVKRKAAIENLARLKNFKQFKTQKAKTSPLPPMPVDLSEIAYALSLFSRCFPPKLFLRLFEEEGKNPAMISRAFSLLCAYGIIESQPEPRLLSNNFSAGEETIPAEKKKLIRLMAHRRLLSWLELRKLNPCFKTLAILAELGGGENLGDELILKSIYADIVAGTVQHIEEARDSGNFNGIFTAEKAAIIGYIYQTTGALLTGGPDEIKAEFSDPPSDCSAFPVLKAQVLVNHSCFYVGQRDIKPALEAIKESIQLSQKKNNFCLAQSYRLFSLANLSKRQSDETNDYLDFAMENAEKSGNCHELGISAYYAAVSQFLFGNVSKAVRLARKAREQA